MIVDSFTSSMSTLVRVMIRAVTWVVFNHPTSQTCFCLLPLFKKNKSYSYSRSKCVIYIPHKYITNNHSTNITFTYNMLNVIILYTYIIIKLTLWCLDRGKTMFFAYTYGRIHLTMTCISCRKQGGWVKNAKPREETFIKYAIDIVSYKLMSDMPEERRSRLTTFKTLRLELYGISNAKNEFAQKKNVLCA